MDRSPAYFDSTLLPDILMLGAEWLSLSISQIDYLVSVLNKKNNKSTSSEIFQVSSYHLLGTYLFAYFYKVWYFHVHMRYLMCAFQHFTNLGPTWQFQVYLISLSFLDSVFLIYNVFLVSQHFYTITSFHFQLCSQRSSAVERNVLRFLFSIIDLSQWDAKKSSKDSPQVPYFSIVYNNPFA